MERLSGPPAREGAQFKDWREGAQFEDWREGAQLQDWREGARITCAFDHGFSLIIAASAGRGYRRLRRRRGGRVVECGGLENRWAFTRPGGSNPSPSAINLKFKSLVRMDSQLTNI